ncbi:MAG: CBS domain-containing protein [Saprospiraceae bacterium]|nr:CBS domain-containing protein [Saprospiraceae bacterium]
MNTKAPVSSIMTTKVLTISPDDPVKVAKEIFDLNKIRHLPVLEEEKLVGILSGSDLLHFLRYLDKDSQEPYLNDLRLKNYKVGEIMQTELATVDEEDSILSILEVFSQNVFHALPVTRGDELVGIVTTQDIVKALLKEETEATV